MAGGALAGGGNQAAGGGGAQSLSQLNDILQKLGGGAGGGVGQGNPLASMVGLGSTMMKPGMQAPTPPPQALARPMIGGGIGPGVPVPQGATPNMGASQGMPIGLMNMALARQNGMM